MPVRRTSLLKTTCSACTIQKDNFHFELSSKPVVRSYIECYSQSVSGRIASKLRFDKMKLCHILTSIEFLSGLYFVVRVDLKPTIGMSKTFKKEINCLRSGARCNTSVVCNQCFKHTQQSCLIKLFNVSKQGHT